MTDGGTAGGPEADPRARYRRPEDRPKPVEDAELPLAVEPTAPPPPVQPPAPAGPVGPAVPAVLAPEPWMPWAPGTSIPNELEARIRRDLGRGRVIVRLTWVAALASLVLGLVAVRQATLLVAIDRRLVTTEEVEAAGASFDAARTVLLVAVIAGVILAVRWLRGALPVFAALREKGVIDGPPPAGDRARDQFRLLWRSAGVPADRAGWADLRVGDGRPVARVAAVVVALALAVGLAAALWLGAATDADASRLLRVVSGIDGALWLVASVMVGVVIDALLWREAAAARALGVFVPLVDAPGRALVRLIPPVLVFVAGVAIASTRPDPWFVPCPSATLTCDGMLVPVDHGAGSAATIWVSYAVHHAEGKPLGTLAIAVGGPGASGLDSAVPMIEGFDEDLVRRYDVLFFDQRGVGASEGRDCPDAGQAYAFSSVGPDAARTFADACVREAEVDPAKLAQYATRQAAEDLDSIRDRLGIERFALYGESYGTEFAQIYAALHPDRLTTLILDGPVDLTLSANAFWADAAHGFGRVLADTLDACAADTDCRADVADPEDAYDDMISGFANGREESYADPDGVVRDHRIDAAGLESAVDALLYDPAGRMLIQRAVAAFANRDGVPAARLIDALGSGEGIGVSSFAYHAITCADYRVSPTGDPHDADAVAAAGTAAGVWTQRTDELYTSQYPCLFWPFQPGDGTRPAPLTATPFPVFVIGATGDPITPIDQARAIAGRLTDGYLIVTAGGPHVTFGRSEPCVDGPVVRFLLEGRRPSGRSINCHGDVADPYIPLTPSESSDYDDALDAMASTEEELFADPAYVLWDGQGDLRIGCRHGGFVAVTAEALRDSLRFADCSFARGLQMTGTGTYAFGSDGAVEWTIKASSAELTYRSTPDGQHVEGTWKGRPVDLSR